MEDLMGQIQEWIAREREEYLAQGPERFSGPEYAYLLEAEEVIFDLDLHDIKNILPTFDVFEAIAGRSHNEFYGTPLCIEARKAFPWISKGQVRELEWQRFAKLFGITNRKAHCFFWKVSFWELRKGLVVFTDEEQ